MAALEIISGVFGPVWDLIANTQVPGLGVSFGTLFLALILIQISLVIIRHAFGIGGSATSYRSGSARNPKISENRKGDEY